MAKKQAAAEAAVIDVGLVISEDEQVAQQVGASIVAFLAGVRAFFQQGQALEDEAQLTLATARRLTLPCDGMQDQALQAFIRKANEDKKKIEEHWVITAVVHKLHRRLTAKRDIGVKALEEAANVGNRLHNTYAEGEKRRAREEEDRQRREAEERARADRELELAEAEAAAVKLEEASEGLSTREQAFVDAYTSDVTGWKGNGQRAAHVAGFKDAFKAAARLLTLPKIQAAIKAKRAASAIRTQAAAKKEQPLHVDVERVVPDVAEGGDRTRWSGEILNEAATIEAFRSGQHGIPGDLFTINPVKLNEYARSLHERLSMWPGVRAKSTTRVV